MPGIIHKEFKGVTHENKFVSSSASPGIPPCALVLTSIPDFIGHTSLKAGGSSSGVKPVHEGNSDTFSLATSSSRSSFCSSWVSGTTSRLQLLDDCTPAHADKYLRGVPLVSFSRWPPLSVSSSPTVPPSFPPTIAASHSVSAPSRIRLQLARSRSPRRSEGPLAHSESRGDGDGAWCTTNDGGGSHSVTMSPPVFLVPL